MAATSLLDWIEEARRKKEEEDKKKAAEAAAAAKYSRVNKDDVYVPPVKVAPADDRQQAIQEARADKASITPTPARIAKDDVYVPPKPVNKTYLPIVANSSIIPEAAPEVTPTSYGPAAPSSSPVDDALQTWRKPDAPTEQPLSFMPAYHSMSSDLQVGVDDSMRPSTGAAGIGATGVTQTGQAPAQPTTQYQPFGQTQQPPTRTFLNANALTGGQPYANYALAAQQNVSTLPTLWNAATDQANDYLKTWGLDWKNPTPTTQQPGVTPVTGNQPLNTGAGAIGASGNTSDTLGINIQTPNKPLQTGGGTFMDWYRQTPMGQYYLPKIEEANKKGGLWGTLEALDLGMQAPFYSAAFTPIPGTGNKELGTPDISAGELVQPLLTTAARAINPWDKQSIWRNPKTFQTENVLKDAANLKEQQSEGITNKDQLLNMQDTTPANAVGDWLKDTYTTEVQKFMAVNKYIQNLPTDIRNKASIALANTHSGPEAVQKTATAIVNQSSDVNTLLKQAQEQYAISQDASAPPEVRRPAALKAAQLGKQAYDLKNMYGADFVDEYTHPGAKFVFDLAANPINKLYDIPFHYGSELVKNLKYARNFAITSETAPPLIAKALEESSAILEKAAGQGALTTGIADAGKSTALIPRTTWESINPLAPTVETKAQRATTAIWNSLGQVMGKVTNKQDAQILLNALIENPQKLIEGVAGMASPELAATADQGLTKFGAGAVANRPLLESFPILKLAKDKIMQMPELIGEGGFSAKDFMAALDGVLFDTARSAYGGGDIAKLPMGAVSSKLRYLGDGTAVIDYLDSAKKVISSSAPQVAYDAEQVFKNIKNTARGTTGGGAIKFLWNMQKGVLADMYLALAPSNWIRNGASAAAHLSTDGIGALHPQADMLSYLNKKMGFVPERGLLGAIEGTEPAGSHWSEALFGKDNWYKRLIDKGQNIRGGFTQVAGVPVGENSYRLLGFYNAFTRDLGKGWTGKVDSIFRYGLEQMGIDPAVANSLAHTATEAGLSGSKADLAQQVRNVLSGNTIKPNLRELGVPDELLSMDGWAKLHDVISNSLPENVEDAATQIKQIFTDELTHRGGILNESPRQMGNYEWTNVTAAHDQAGMADTLRNMGKQAGIDPNEIEQTVQGIAQKLEDTAKNAWETFRNDVKAAQNPQDALRTVFDTYVKHNELQAAAREAVDKLGNTAAVSGADAAAWAEKWKKTPEIYNKLAEDVSNLFAGTRAKLNGLTTGEAQPAMDWYKAIERYINYDEATVMADRAMGMGLGSPSAENATAYQKAIDANRAVVDKSLLELYDAFRRNPTQEAMDMLVHAQKKIEEMGAQAAHFLSQQRELLQTGQLSKDAYSQLRNQVWGQFTDNAAIHNRAVQRYIVADGLTNQWKQYLTWDDGGLGPVRLIAPDTEKVVNASNDAQKMVKAQTGTRAPRESTYDVWQVMKQDGTLMSVADKYIPDEVKQAWSKIVNSDGDVQAVIDDISKTVQPYVPTPEAPPFNAEEAIRRQGGKTATQIADEQRAAKKAAEAAAQQAPTAAPVAQQYGPIDNPNKGGMVGVRRTAEGDEPITIFGKSYTKDGVDYYSISGTPEKVPADQLYMLNNKNQLYGINDIGQIKQAEEAAGRAGDELAGYQEARKAMRDEWYKVAKAEGGYLNLDSAATLYNRGGIVNVPENKFEDLYGKTIAGHQINNQEDVNRFIQDYVDMQAQIKKAEKAAKEAKTVHKAYKLNYEEAPNAKDIRNAVKQWNPLGLEAGEEAAAAPAATKAAQPMSEATGLAKGEEAMPQVHPQQAQVDKAVAENTAQSLSNNALKAPEVSEVMGSHMLEKLKVAEQKILDKLPEILTGKPNTLTEAQRVQAYDLLMKQLLPEWDSAVVQAKTSAADAMNFAMLNYNDRRNMDAILGYAFPFHYYYTRSGFNWFMRVLSKPSILHTYNEYNRDVAIENKQANLPPRLMGTLPFKDTVGMGVVGPDRIQDPVGWLLPIGNYAGNKFVNEEDGQTDYEKWYLRVKKYAPSILPFIEAGTIAALDYASPLPNGETRFKASDYGPNKFIPAINVAGAAYSAATGNKSPELPGGFGPLWGDEYDPYRVGRDISKTAAGSTADDAQIIAGYAQQIAYNKANGKPTFDKIPQQYQAKAQDAYQAGVSGAATDSLWSNGLRMLTGTAGYNYGPEEQKLQQESKDLYGLGYDKDTNPTGSKTAMDTYRDQHPELQSWNNKSALVPNANADKLQPAESTQLNSMLTEQDAIKAAQSKELESYLAVHKNDKDQKAVEAQVAAIKKKYRAQMDAVEKKYPNARFPESTGQPPKGMNPKERAEWQLKQFINGSKGGDIPRPAAGDTAEEMLKNGATPEQIQKYYSDVENKVNAQLDELEQDSNAFLNADTPWRDAAAKLTGKQTPEGPTLEGADWMPEFKKLVKGRYAADIIRDYKSRDAGPNETEWTKADDFRKELSGAQHDATQNNLKQRLGDKAAALWDEYGKLPKEGDARQKFKQAHPELQFASLAAYSPDKYDEVTKRFGANAFAILSGAPDYPGENATEAQKAAYNKAVAAYADKYPQYAEIKMWVNGRRRKFEQAPEGMVSQRNLGADYNEAVKIFGPDVFKAWGEFPPKGSKPAVYDAFYKKYPRFKGFFNWLDEVQDQSPNYVPESSNANQPLPEGWDKYNGPRPLGSDRQPIGLQPGDQPPPKWDLSALTGKASTSTTGPAPTGATPAAPTNKKDQADYAAESDAAYREEYKKKYGHYPDPNAGKYSADWDAYRKLSPEGKRQYLLDHPEFGKYYHDKYGYGGNSKKSQEYAAARGNVYKQFGNDAGAVWEAYGKLPKGSKAREDYKAAHPELRIYDMAAYNPKEYEAATKLFGNDAWGEWAHTPPAGTTDEEKAARQQYLDEHPNAKLLNAWIYGRPSAKGEQDGEGVKQNFGADFAAAQKQFGDNIWAVFAGYKNSFSKEQKKAYFDKFPQLTKFFDWWYGNSGGQGAGAGYGRGYGGGGFRSYGGGGGYYGGGGGGGGGGHDNPPTVYARQMDKDLIVQAPQLQAWRPQKIDLSWMHAGDYLKEDKLKSWKR